jgi:uncharacterized protein YbjT (DUF2867 family)
MKVLVVGANGKVGQRIVKKLADHNHEPIAMIRNEDQRAAFEAKGAQVVVADLEKDISHAFTSHLDAVVFTAGSGGHTGKDKTVAVDLQGARKTIDEAVKHKVSRYVMVSALGANRAKEMPSDMQHYFMAKSEADQHLVQSALDYTIFRPGRLTDESGNGSVAAAESLEDTSEMDISRDNLANAIVDALDKRNTHKKVIELVNGSTPVKDAIAAI